MGVDVDEPGRDDAARGVDHPCGCGGGLAHLANRADQTTADHDVASVSGQARSVDDQTVADDEIRLDGAARCVLHDSIRGGAHLALATEYRRRRRIGPRVWRVVEWTGSVSNSGSRGCRTFVGLLEDVHVVVAHRRAERELVGADVDELLDGPRDLVGVAYAARGRVGPGLAAPRPSGRAAGRATRESRRAGGTSQGI